MKGFKVLLSALILNFAFSLAPSLSDPLISSSLTRSANPKAISDLKDAIVKGLGFHADDFKISGFDMRDALVGHSVAYEFDVEFDNKVFPFKLLEDVTRWEYVELPLFRVEDSDGKSTRNAMVEHRPKPHSAVPVLAPFQLAGPLEIWIQDAEDMRLSLPHDVDAGVLKKVILAEGAVVTVKGARSVSLRHPIDLPLPLNQTNNGIASGILALAEYFRQQSSTRGAPVLSLRIVGPTSLTSPSASSNKLKLKRLAPGLVELSSHPKRSDNATVLRTLEFEEAETVLSSKHLSTMWPLSLVNGSNSNLVGFEKLLASVLGPKAGEKGFFRLSKADVSAQTFVKLSFGVEKKLKEGDALWQGLPDWRTKPERIKMHFEVLAKVEGDRVIPERIVQADTVLVEDTFSPNVLLGNVTLSTLSGNMPPPNPFTL